MCGTPNNLGQIGVRPDCDHGALGQLASALRLGRLQVTLNRHHARFVIIDSNGPPYHVYTPADEPCQIIRIASKSRRTKVNVPNSAIRERPRGMRSVKRPNVKVVYASVATYEMLSAALTQTHQDAAPRVNPRRGAKEEIVEVGIREDSQVREIIDLNALE
jgi:hypothetical protein